MTPASTSSTTFIYIVLFCVQKLLLIKTLKIKGVMWLSQKVHIKYMCDVCSNELNLSFLIVACIQNRVDQFPTTISRYASLAMSDVEKTTTRQATTYIIPDLSSTYM